MGKQPPREESRNESGRVRMLIAIQSSAIQPTITAMPIFTGAIGSTMHSGTKESKTSNQESRCVVADVPNAGASELVRKNSIGLHQ